MDTVALLAEISILKEQLEAYCSTGLTPEEVKELAEAKAEGWLVALPCRVGQVLYRAEKDEFFEASILSFHADEYNQYFEDVNGNEFSADEYKASLGKTVFRTREEAEAALLKEDAK